MSTAINTTDDMTSIVLYVPKGMNEYRFVIQAPEANKPAATPADNFGIGALVLMMVCCFVGLCWVVKG